MPSLLDRIYTYSPTWVQNIGISAYGYVWRNRRFGGNFQEYVTNIKQRESYTAIHWHAYQTQQLRKLLKHAVQNVSYYKQKFSLHCLQDLLTFEVDQLSELPLLEKEEIRSNPTHFLASKSSNDKLFTYKTSGTTGTPISIKFSSDMHHHWSAAYEARVRHWAGVNNHMSRAMIGGRLIIPTAKAKPPFWRYNIAERQLYMSAFHIAPQNAKHYVDALNHYKPDYLVGYASSHFFLARMIQEQNLKIIQPKAILTSSEKLTLEMRTVLEEVYRCPVFDAYSGVEACCLASECEYHRLHISPDIGIIELLDEDGKPVPPGVQGQIVATGLLNFDQPLIRYKTGDWAIISSEECPCGRKMPIITELVGRLEDLVVGPDGREMVRFHGIFVGLPYIREGQVIQESLRSFRVRLVTTQGFSNEERIVIKNRFYERLGDVEVLIDIVDGIERTERGKYRAVISHVKRHSI